MDLVTRFKKGYYSSLEIGGIGRYTKTSKSKFTFPGSQQVETPAENGDIARFKDGLLFRP